MTNRSNSILPAIVLSVLAFDMVGNALADDLAKASQNPVGDIVSVPIEFWHHGGMPGDSSATVLTTKPVYPVNLGELNLINRLIIPYLGVDANLSRLDLGKGEIPPSDVERNGLGNIQYQAFLTPAKPGKIIWGAGPVLEVPSHTDDLGSSKWSAGPAAVVLAMPGDWVLGALAQNIWSFAGPSSAESINKFVFQYFVNYNLPNGWYLTSTPVITADWNKPSNDRWTVPLGGGAGRLVKFGKQPVDFKVQAFANVVHPDAGPDWTVMAAVKFLFPK
jgi:hypothetical protein